MKRTLTILTTILLAGALLFACGIIPNTTTSFVTIRFGDSPQKAMLKAEAATPWARAQYFLAGVKLMPEAHAYIPSVVQVIIVTVTAADMTMPIVGVASVKNTDTAALIRIEVPNGSARQFLVEGYRGVDSKVYYSGTASADLSGMDVDLPISMALVGPGIYVDPSLTPATADQPSCGTKASPCATITYVLNTRSSTTSNDVILALPGTYKVGSVAAQETFPLQLKPGMVLLCTGTGFSSVIDLQSAATTAVYGNDGASVDNCMVRVYAAAGGGAAVNDAIGGVAGQQSRVRVNGVYIELSGSPTGLANVGTIFNDDSLLLESAVTGSAASGSVYGVQVKGGKPGIIGNTISNLPRGIDLTTGASDVVIENNIIDANSTGIWIATAAKPTIRTNSIGFGGTGIYVIAGTPVITGNTINNNSIGLDVEIGAGSPTIQSNSLYCNGIADFFTNLSTALDIRGNAWDHDLTTSPSGTFGPTDMTSNNGAFGCGAGVDICYQDTSPQPNYTSILPAVPNGCLIPIAKPAP